MPSGKATPEPVKYFILGTKRNAPELSNPQIAEKIQAKFRMNIDKSTVGNILQREGLNRRRSDKNLTSQKPAADYRLTATLLSWHQEVRHAIEELCLTRALEKGAPVEALWLPEELESPSQTVQGMYEEEIVRQFESLGEPDRLPIQTHRDPLFPLMMERLCNTGIPEVNQTWVQERLEFIHKRLRWHFKINFLANCCMLQSWRSPAVNAPAATGRGGYSPPLSPLQVSQWRALAKVLACDLLVQEISRRHPSVPTTLMALQLHDLRKQAQESLADEFAGLQRVPFTDEMVRSSVRGIPYIEEVVDGLGPLLDAYVGSLEAGQTLLDRQGEVLREWHGSL